MMDRLVLIGYFDSFRFITSPPLPTVAVATPDLKRLQAQYARAQLQRDKRQLHSLEQQLFALRRPKR